MVIGLQIGKLHRGGGRTPPALPDSEKPGLFRVKLQKVTTMFCDIQLIFHEHQPKPSVHSWSTEGDFNSNSFKTIFHEKFQHKSFQNLSNIYISQGAFF